MTRKTAFTLIELLVVIAIIGILAAILFPVYARTRDSAYRSSDISNLNSLRTAIQLYKVDQGAYPPVLLGYVNPYQQGNVTQANVVPANQLVGALYPKRVESIETFRPAYDRVTMTDTTTAVWPTQDPRALGSAPIVDTNGDGKIDATDDIAGARQAFGPNDGFVTQTGGQLGVTNDPNLAQNYYAVDGYDTALVKTPTGSRREVHYALFWTVFGVGGGNHADDPRQLGYSDPPETTPITWDSYFREYTNGVPDRGGKREIVLFVGGGARVYDAHNASDWSWRSMP